MGMQATVLSGCLPGASASTASTIPSCRAYVLDSASDPPALLGFEETTPRTVTYTGGDGVYWLLGRATPVLQPPGWTCLPGTHYCWQKGDTQPTAPSSTLLLARSTVASGAVTTVEPLMASVPINTLPLDATVYASQHGMRCDGVTDNSAALEAAQKALPPTGGTLVIPAAAQPCLYSRSFLITTNMTVRGGGGTRAGPKTPRSVLQYTGSGTAIDIRGAMTQGAQLREFELDHSGTAEYGIAINGTSSVLLDDVSIALPSVPFSIAGVALGQDDSTTPPHSIMLYNVYLRASAPVGLWVVRSHAFVVVQSAKILRHLDTNVLLGRLSTPGPAGLAEDVHFLATTLENQEPGSNAIQIHRAEGVHVDHCHFEVGPPNASALPARALLIHNTAERAAPVYLTNNRITALTGATELLTVNLPAALVVLENNWLEDGSGGTLPAYITNASVGHLVVGQNRIGSTSIALVSDRRQVTLAGNMDISGVGRLDGHWPARLCQSTPSTGTTDSSEATLASCTLPANTLYRDDMGFELLAAGQTAANATPKRVRVLLGTQELFDTALVAANADHWQVTCEGQRSNSTGVFVSCRGQIYDVQTGGKITHTGFSTSGWAQAQQLSVAGTGGAVNDVTLQLFRVSILP